MNFMISIEKDSGKILHISDNNLDLSITSLIVSASLLKGKFKNVMGIIHTSSNILTRGEKYTNTSNQPEN